MLGEDYKNNRKTEECQCPMCVLNRITESCKIMTEGLIDPNIKNFEYSYKSKYGYEVLVEGCITDDREVRYDLTIIDDMNKEIIGGTNLSTESFLNLLGTIINGLYEMNE